MNRTVDFSWLPWLSYFFYLHLFTVRWSGTGNSIPAMCNCCLVNLQTPCKEIVLAPPPGLLWIICKYLFSNIVHVSE